MDADDYAESHRDVYGVSDRIIESLNIFIMVSNTGATWSRVPQSISTAYLLA